MRCRHFWRAREAFLVSGIGRTPAHALGCLACRLRWAVVKFGVLNG